MEQLITNEAVIAYSLCPRKAHLLGTRSEHTLTAYVQILADQAAAARTRYLQGIRQQHPSAASGIQFLRNAGHTVFIDVELIQGDLHASCDVLTKLSHTSPRSRDYYDPTIIVGSNCISTEQKLELAYIGFVLGQIQKQTPTTGTIVGANGRAHRIKLLDYIRSVENTIKKLRESARSNIVPPAFLNPHCPYCQFRLGCMEVAEKDDSLSLLSRMTPKIAKQFNKKGIFTVNQLSYVFRPRRSKKPRTSGAVQFKFELQAMALRTGQIYVQRPPDIKAHGTEVFIDTEGIPDDAYRRIAEHYRKAHHPHGQRMLQFDGRPYKELLRQGWEAFYAKEIERLASDQAISVAILSMSVYDGEPPGEAAEEFLQTLLDWRYEGAQRAAL